MKINVYHVPSIIVILLILTIGTTLFLTYGQHHVSGSLPYISDTGTLPPESCIFGQALNMLWVMISFAMFIKYRQTTYLFKQHNMEKYQSFNRRTLNVGILAAFGSSIVANFQETNMFLTHWVGAVLVFGLGSVYQCMQAVLYIHLIPVIGQKMLSRVRLGLAFLSLASFMVFFVCAVISYNQKTINGGYLHWKKEDGGYEYHNISVIAEWVCASSTMVFLMLFSKEFKKLKIKCLQISIVKTGNDIDTVESIT